MSVKPCPNVVDCPGSDFPIMNWSSEGPDLPQYEAIGYCCNGQQMRAYSLNSQADADDALQRLMAQYCPSCDPVKSYCATVECPGGTMVATVCVGTSQADADASAAALKEKLDCENLDSAYKATSCCADGSNCTTAYSPNSQAEAQLLADSVPKTCLVGNDAQICKATCPDGTEFWWLQAAGTIMGTTKAEANSKALILACTRAKELKICLGAITLCCCKDQAYASTVRASGVEAQNGASLNWELADGTFPPGLVFHGGIRSDGKCEIDGVPTAAGRYTFTVRVTTLFGSYAWRQYTISVIALTTTTLPEYTVGVYYLAHLEAEGGSGHYKFSVVSGTLPTGLTLEDDGTISGIPTVGGSTNITFEVIDLACP